MPCFSRAGSKVDRELIGPAQREENPVFRLATQRAKWASLILRILRPPCYAKLYQLGPLHKRTCLGKDLTQVLIF